MQFDHLRARDAVLALVLAFAACFAGASYRGVLADRFVVTRADPPPVVAATRAVELSPSPPVRLIAKLPRGAAVLDRAASDGQPIAQIRPGAVVEVSTTKIPGWRRLRTQRIDGWVSEASLASEAESSAAIALFDSVSRITGSKVRTAHAGALYANPQLSQPIGGFSRGDGVEILRNSGRVLLVAIADGAGGRLVGYARTADVRALVAAPPASTPMSPRPGPEASTPQASAAEPDASFTAGSGAAALHDAEDQYASGNFQDALARAEQAVALGSPDASVLVAMSACKLGDLAKALHHARRLRGGQLSQFHAACPSAEQSPPVARGTDEATEAPGTAPSDAKSPEEP